MKLIADLIVFVIHVDMELGNTTIESSNMMVKCKGQGWAAIYALPGSRIDILCHRKGLYLSQKSSKAFCFDLLVPFA